MALTDKNIVITPNIGQAADPSIVFSGADAATTAQNITVRVYPTNNGTLSFEGTQGQLFSINNNFTGTIFSVNDISGIPSIEVLDTGEIKLAQYSGVVRVLSSTSATSTSSGALQVSGGVGIAGNTYVGGNLNVLGLITGNVSLTGNISTATNLSGGTAGQIHYQSAPGLTAFAGPGTAGQILVSAGAAAPVYTNTSSIYVGNASISNNLLGGTTGQLPYQTGANATAFVGPGTAGQILVSAGAAAPVYTNTASIYVNSSVFAEEIRGGTAGQLLYQSAANATGYVGPGVAGQVLVSGGSGSPVYQNTLTLAGTTAATSTNTGALVVAGGAGIAGSLYVGGTLFASVSGSITTATNIAAGTAGQLHYQTAPGLTGFVATATNVGGVLVNNGGSAPTFNNVLTLLGTTAATSTLTGALQVRGGVGIGGNLYVGGSIFAGNLTGSISTATNLAGGVAGNIPIQTGPGVTSFITNGTAGQVLVSSGTGAAWGSYTAPTSVEATTATHLALGTVNQIPYQSGTGRTTWSANFTYNGTNFTVGSGNATANAFIPAGSTVPTNGLYLPAANSVALATNSTARLTVSSTGTITSSGDVRITSTTAASSSATGALVVAGGMGVAGDLYVGGVLYGANLGAVSTATHLAVGTTNQIPYQSALGRTTWSANFQYNGTDLTIGSGKVNAYAFTPTSSSMPVNGLYLPAVNSVGLATNSTARLTIDASGNSSFSGNVSVPTLTSSQGVADGNTGLRLMNPGGGSYVSTGALTGAIKIKFPPASFNSSSMVRFTVKIYEYAGTAAGTSRTLEIGGYNYSGGNWYNFFATQQTMGGSDVEVRFGQDATSDCVWVGTTATVWQYPQVFVTDVQVGYSAYSVATWANGWVVSIVSAFDTVEQGPIIASKPLTVQNYNSYAPTLTGVGATGTWNINIAGGSQTTVNATNATNTRYVQSPDGNRDANNADKYPNAWQRGLRLDFATAASTGVNGNYAGLMTYVPWDGTTGSTGDASYQLAFGGSAVNGGGVPKLNIRKGIDTTWNSWYQIHHDGVADQYATASMRAPIFYDSNDTGYYVDPAGTTKLSALTVSSISLPQNTVGTTYGNGVSTSPTYSFYQLVGDNDGIRIYGEAPATNQVRMVFQLEDDIETALEDQWVFRNKKTYTDYIATSPFAIGGSGNTYSATSSRAPIFYDSNDTAYYLDPAATTTSLQIAGAIEQGNNMSRPNVDWGAAGTTTGMVIIKFPGAVGNYGMIHAVVDVYEYSGNVACTITIGGHNWNGAWYNYGAQVEGYTDKTVRVGFKDGQYCIVIGGAASSWSYGQVRLRKIQNGSYYNNQIDLGGTYTVSQTATESFTWVSGDLRYLSTPATMYAAGDVRSPIFYDSNDTNYYINPNGASVVNGLKIVQATDNASGGDAAVWIQGNSSDWGLIVDKASYEYGIQTNLASSHSYAYRALKASSEYYRVGTDLMYHNASMRAPIFYDTDNTAYYLDPASTSILNGVSFYNGLYSNNKLNFNTFDGTATNGQNRMSASLHTRGNRIYVDETFLYGNNSINVYDNAGSGQTTITRISSAGLVAPNNSGYVLRIQHTGSSQSPGYGGFYFAVGCRANATLTCVFKAKLPAGYTINWASNSIGTGGASYWSTDNVGTGKWEDYVYVVRCGDSGTFSSTHFFYITGSPTPTAAAPLTWYLASATVYDVDDRTSYLQVNSLGVGTAASGTLGEIRATNNVTAYYSDMRLKTKLGTIENPIKKVMKLTGFYFEANEVAQSLGYKKMREVGVSAQEVLSVLPEIVKPAPIDEKYYTLDYSKLVPLLIEAIKEQQTTIEAQNQRLAVLENALLNK